MFIVRWNLKAVGCGESTSPWASLWSDEQKCGQGIKERMFDDSVLLELFMVQCLQNRHCTIAHLVSVFNMVCPCFGHIEIHGYGRLNKTNSVLNPGGGSYA